MHRMGILTETGEDAEAKRPPRKKNGMAPVRRKSGTAALGWLKEVATKVWDERYKSRKVNAARSQDAEARSRGAEAAEKADVSQGLLSWEDAEGNEEEEISESS